MKTQSPLFVLLGAAKYLDEHGWCQYDMGKHGGPRCAFGALISATCAADKTIAYPGEPRRTYQARNALNDAARTLRRVIGGAVYTWNDLHGQTRERITYMLNTAADWYVEHRV